MDTISAVLPFALAGSILPTWTVMVITLLGTERPIANASAFIAGNAAFRFALGLAVLFALPVPQGGDVPLDPGAYDARLVIGFGALLFTGALWLWNHPSTSSRAERRERTERIQPKSAFIAGVVTVASPGVQYAYLLGGIAAILETARPAHSVLALVLFVIALQLVPATPVVLYALFRERAGRVLKVMNAFFSKHGNRLVAGVLGAVGGYLVAVGILRALAEF